MNENAKAIAELLAQMIGTRTPGGCDSCDAHQEMTQESDGVFVMLTSHDDWCPVLARMRKTTR